MSQHDDNVFVRNLTIVLGALVGLSIFVFILSQMVTKDLANSDQQGVEARIKPVGQVSISTAAAPGTAAVAAAPKTGKDIYNGVCMACHTTGIAGAPKLGDKAGWDPRLAQGQETVIKNAINGIRGMPARGGRADLNDADVKLAVEYMLAEVGVKPGAAPAPETKPATPTTVPEAKPVEPAPVTPPEIKPATPAPEVKPVEAAKPAEAVPPIPEATPAAAPAAMTTEQVTALMAQKGYACLACHQVEAKMVGPAFKEIAAKYQGDATAAATLAGKVKQGAAGTWGAVPMPPNPTVADDDMKAIVQWVLSLQ
ncbi:MAG: hypothetical protein BWK79_06480 [Beggiatoa sp. IS2]|nr:MAG: hypothetical protein BWK79_06480 [Beggiatoa sp. IS2]